MELILNNDQLKALFQMLWIVADNDTWEHPVEELIVDEIMDVVDSKIKKQKVKLKLTPSQFLILFIKMNTYTFSDPYNQTLSVEIVRQIDKQRIDNGFVPEKTAWNIK